MCEEQAQGNGATTVRVMRQRTQARQGGGIPPTKYRAADGGCSAREESRFSPKRETNACAVCPVPEDALRGFVLGRSRAEPSRVRRLRQDSPPTAYMYTPSGAKDAGIGRSRKASTVARNKAAHWKASQRDWRRVEHVEPLAALLPRPKVLCKRSAAHPPRKDHGVASRSLSFPRRQSSMPTARG